MRVCKREGGGGAENVIPVGVAWGLGGGRMSLGEEATPAPLVPIQQPPPGLWFI